MTHRRTATSRPGRVQVTRRRRARKTTLVLTVLSMCAALGTLGVPPAAAVHATGAFELDGNALDGTATAGDDWENVCHQVNSTATGCPSGTNTHNSTARTWLPELNLNATIFSGGGSKDPIDVSSWAWKDGAGGLPDKDNLLHSFAARYSLAPTDTGASAGTCPAHGASMCDVIFFGSDRYDNSGDAQQGFWFFQNAIGLGSNAVGGGSGFTGVHRNGDLLVISDFSNGGTKSTITVYAWDTSCKRTSTTCGDANLRILETSTSAKCASSLVDSDSFCGIVNPTNGTASPWPYTDKSGNHSYLNGEFYEGGINLSALGLDGECFSSVASETRSSTSTTAVLKDFVLGSFGECTSSVVTTPKDGSGATIPTGGIPIGTDGKATARDSALVTVGGASSWTGSIQFALCGPLTSADGCVSGTPIGSPVAVSNANNPVLSPVATVTSAGLYCWRADFTSTQTGVPPAADGSSGECFTVAPVQPRLSTSAGPDVLLGNAVTDTATLAGTANQPGSPVIGTSAGGPAAGTITFSLYGPSTTGCGSLVHTVSPATTVSGDGDYTPAATDPVVPTTPGTYHWVATYSGNSPNTLDVTHNAACSDSSEDVVVTSVPSSLTTAQSFIPNDSATVSASQGGNMAGSVTFTAYTQADCAGTALFTQTRPVSGASPVTVSTTNTTVSTTSPVVWWKVSYTSTNTAQRSIADSCVEHTALTITNGGPVSST